MTEFVSLADAVSASVSDGDHVALEGFTHLIPHAAGHELIRQRRKGLTLYRMTPDVVYDQLIGMGLARKLVFSWGGNPGVGSLHRLRDAVERNWPHPLEIEERSHADMATAYVAGASNLPFGVLRGYCGSDLPRHSSSIAEIRCPFTQERLTAVPSIRPDVTFIHAQRADEQGNVQLWGISGVQKEAALAARRVVVTVEEVVDRLPPVPTAVTLPNWVIDAICTVPGGAHPSYALGFYERDNHFYQAWDRISRDRDVFRRWIDDYIFGTEDFKGFLGRLNLSQGRARHA